MDCFNKIRDDVVRNVNSWDDDRKEIAYEALKGGKAILKNQDELDRYIFAYGSMHQAKLNCAFQTIDDLNKIDKKEISIIDYGCGQGVGSIVLIDYLNSQSLDYSISNIKLIEPSKIALQMAQKYIGIDNIKLINSDINEVSPNDLKTNDKNVTFHIFSNILDVEEVNIESIFKNMTKSLTGINYIVCVSPDYWSAKQKLDKFVKYFRGNLSDKEFAIISERQVEINNPNSQSKPWKGCEKVFKIVR